MSFLGGAECSTAGNPLSQFTKHVQDDKSLQRDRLVGRGPGGMGESMRSQPMGPGPQDAVRLPPPLPVARYDDGKTRREKNETKENKSGKKCSYSNCWVLMYDEPDDG